jgi:hypothetical protein
MNKSGINGRESSNHKGRRQCRVSETRTLATARRERKEKKNRMQTAKPVMTDFYPAEA